RLHANPRFAEVCSQCGSRELSTPQPRVSVWLHFLRLLLRIASGAFLALLSLVLLGELLKSPAVQNSIVALGFLVIALWAAWSMLPDWFRKLIHRVLRRRQNRDER